MEHIYVIKTDVQIDESGKAVLTYGIEARDKNQQLLCSIPDVFLDLSKATKLVALCNSLELSPLHLYDIVEDALAE